MNLEYVWWILALILAGGGVLAFLAFGRVPEIEDEDETADATTDAADPATAPPATAPPATAPPAAADLEGVRSGPAE
jgi:hypothetical protein